MTPPQPPSQTLRELVERLKDLTATGYLFLDEYNRDMVSAPTWQLFGARLGLAHDTLIEAEAALAAQEASPQPDLAREWFEKGFQAGVNAIDKYGDQHQTLEEHYLAACRQEQP